MLPVRSLLTIAAFGLCTLGTGVALADVTTPEPSGVELAATLGGRIIGAAKACGINSERVRRASERLVSVVNAKATSPAEKESVKAHFASAQAAGAELVRFENSKCSEIHVSFSEIEVKLGRAPVSDNDPVAMKRGVPALGALRSDTLTGNIR